MVHGLAMNLPPENLTAIVNTGDDFTHLGLYISPDIDTVTYTLAQKANSRHGWGVEGETWNVFETLQHLNAPTWFQLGDKDLATHLTRTHLLNQGMSLTSVTKYFCNHWHVKTKILPMSDEPVRTMVHTLQGQTLSFQEYFVKEQCLPVVSGFSFEGLETAKAGQEVIRHIKEADIIIICPSNPWLSIDPILGLKCLREEISKKPVIAISPIISGETIKGPAAKICMELGIKPSATSVAVHYQELLTAFVFDEKDRLEIKIIHQLGIIPFVTDTFMRTDDDRRRLASEIIALGKTLINRSNIT
ncbi:MAG: 2-phospho-L-lactate transferase [Anaerolineaceae bacterium]|nr:2-phospho-L-lactate transferase [Anaerolineaceae bacterium]